MAAKDKLIDLLQDRFAGHEMEVPPGAWEAISGQLAQVAGADALRETLQDKFDAHEVDVDPGVWQNISSQLGHGAAAGGAGASTTGWLAAGAAAVVVTGGLLVWSSSGSPALPEPVPVVVEVPAPAPLADVPADANTTTLPTPEVAAHPVTAPTATTPAAERKAMASEPRTTVPSTSNAVPSDEVDEKGLAMVEKILRDLERMQPSAPMTSTQSVPGASPKPSSMPAKDAEKPNGDTASDPADTPAPLNNNTPEPANGVVEPNIYIPNIFTPNGDGYNETLEAKGTDYRSVVVRIFSARDNTLVFQAKDLEHSWDGRLPSGQPAEAGMYF
ncbi:MAG TPA: gliding motility-associated C-terminal domain-containing protein, partial [Flavobacteriales bacterium]